MEEANKSTYTHINELYFKCALCVRVYVNEEATVFDISKKAKRQKRMSKIESEYGLWTTKDAAKKKKLARTPPKICILDVHLLTN